MADGDHILVADVPDRTLLIDMFEKMDMGANQAGGMTAGKFTDSDSVRSRNLRLWFFTQVDFSFRKVAQCFQARLELGLFLCNCDLWVSR